MKRCTIGVDIGSTSTKAVLYDVEGRHSLHVASDTTRPVIYGIAAGHYEEDPIQLREAAYSAIREVTRYATENDHSLEGICFTGQMHGGLIVDRDLKPLTNFVTWQDKRGDETLNEMSLVTGLATQVDPATLAGLGTDVHTGFLGITLAWWKKNNLIPAHAYKATGIYEWIAATISDFEVVTDPSSAAAWGLYSVRESSYISEIVDALGLSPGLLPEVRGIGDRVGSVTPVAARLLGLPSGLPIYNSMGDTQASYLGSGCRPHEVLLNFGTGSQIMWESTDFVRYEGTDLRHLSRGRYLVTGPTLAGGKAYAILNQFYADVLKQIAGVAMSSDDIYERMNTLASESGNSGLKFTPYFNGSRTHGHDLRASLSGLDSNNFNTSNVTRALLEGMVDELWEPYDQSDHPHHTSLVGSGNGMKRNKALQQIAEARFGMPLRMTDTHEEAAVGAAMVAARSGDV